MKCCRVCGEVKPLAEFYRAAGNADGRENRCSECSRAANRQHSKEVPDLISEYNRRRNARIRQQVFDHYGWFCACCGAEYAENPERGALRRINLTIDHVFGDGKAHAEVRGARKHENLARWLIKNNFPRGFQILCWPCNTSKMNGPCCWLLHKDMPAVIERRRRAFELRSAGVSIEDRAAIQGIPLTTAAMDDIWLAGRAGMAVLRRMLAEEPAEAERGYDVERIARKYS